MNNTVNMPHQGKNVKRIREMLGIKQDALAIDLDISQQAVPLLEQKETLDALTLEKVAKILGVPEEAIKNFNEEAAINIISSTLHDSSIANTNINPTFTFNPLDKIVELYQRMIQAEKDKNELLQKVLNKK